ncbi:sugar efflux transporter [Parasalinivibrio latis]|uniref:sugar efflux transporter n=1 Tax=Parasalinivibrio latis TaxID=2952610 RepID=UPI0030E2FC7E
MAKNRTMLLFVFSTFISGLGGAFLFPISSIYLVEALGASPKMLSVYMMSSVIAGITVSYQLAKLSDRGFSRKNLIAVAMVCYFLTAVIFAFNRDYWVALVTVVVVTSISSAAFPQIFALGREYADSYLGDKGTLFLNTMRAGIAIAWVCGPPLAFMTQAEYGFTYSFLVTAACSCVSLIVALNLPDIGCAPNNEDAGLPEVNSAFVPIPWYRNGQVVLFFIAVVLMFYANNLYIISMPLYVTQDLGLHSGIAGKMMGLAALSEIPIMLGIGIVASRHGAHRILMIGVAFGAVFYAGMLSYSLPWQMMTLQVFNGLFIGATATMGMVVMQDLMKNQMGVATTLFSNGMQTSMLLSSMTIGIVGEYFSYHEAFFVSFIMAMLSLLTMAFQSVLNRRKSGINGDECFGETSA